MKFEISLVRLLIAMCFIFLLVGLNMYFAGEVNRCERENVYLRTQVSFFRDLGGVVKLVDPGSLELTRDCLLITNYKDFIQQDSCNERPVIIRIAG